MTGLIAFTLAAIALVLGVAWVIDRLERGERK